MSETNSTVAQHQALQLISQIKFLLSSSDTEKLSKDDATSLLNVIRLITDKIS